LRILIIFVLAASLLLAACATNQKTNSAPKDYVEIDNPGLTMSPDAPAKIWVPRSYVENGIPRGSVLAKAGTEKVVQAFSKTPEQTQPVVSAQQPTAATPSQYPPAIPQAVAVTAPQPVAVAPISNVPAHQQTVAIAQPMPIAERAPTPAVATPTVKNRIAIMDLGQNGLAQPLYENMRRAVIGRVLDPNQTAFLAQYTAVSTDAEKAAFATRLQQDYGANEVIYLSAPDGLTSGKAIIAEVYDAMGGGLLSRFEAVISLIGGEQADRNAAIAPALASLTEKIKELVADLPWYGRITAVEGNRAYIAAGKETCLPIGQILRIYRNGKFMKGLGYAPGELIGTMVVQGFIGPNGSFGVIKEGQGIQPTDLVSAE
jgi:hypothetical protein